MTVQINVVHLSFLVVKETGKKSINFSKKYDYKKYNENFSTSVIIIMFNILISEGSCDTEVMMLKIQLYSFYRNTIIIFCQNNIKY